MVSPISLICMENSFIIGLIVTGELACDGCGMVMKHPERYAYIYKEENPLRFCEQCSRERGYLRKQKVERGQEIETFL